jgi:choline dehydrogenase-like flavoprotein
VDLKKTYEYLVVGSGPGGATVARELTDAGRSCLIVEYGPRLNKTGFLQVAPKAFLDETKKALRSEGDIWFGRPRILGGGSYVAMGNAATPPQKILDEWGMNLSAELGWARKALRVMPMPEKFMGQATKRINQGAASLGWEMKPTPKCVDFAKCRRCSLCMFGCPAGAKWTSLEFVDEATAKGAELLLETKVTRIIHANGKVTGITAVSGGEEFEIRADNVILAAGALSTPVILQNSDIPAGKGLAGDIFQTTYGHHPEMGMKGEIILATYLESAITERELFPAPYMYIPFIVQRDMDGGFPEKLGRVQQAKMILRSKKVDTSRLIGMMTKIRDDRTGEVHKDGSIHKHLTGHDRAKLAEAHEMNRAILIAAGAKPETIFTGVYESGHPCCTAAIGEVVDHNQETEIRGLFVSDASVFPSPLGMPPILTIVALSKRLVNHLLDR